MKCATGRVTRLCEEEGVCCVCFCMEDETRMFFDAEEYLETLSDCSDEFEDAQG